MHICRSPIKPVVTHGCETWVLKDMHEKQLRVSEKKVMRKTHGPIKYQDGSWRIRTNEEIRKFPNKICRYI